jgi:hypothetical protein
LIAFMAHNACLAGLHDPRERATGVLIDDMRKSDRRDSALQDALKVAAMSGSGSGEAIPAPRETTGATP